METEDGTDSDVTINVSHETEPEPEPPAVVVVETGGNSETGGAADAAALIAAHERINQLEADNLRIQAENDRLYHERAERVEAEATPEPEPPVVIEVQPEPEPPAAEPEPEPDSVPDSAKKHFWFKSWRELIGKD
jgi:hypothetical protein